MRYRIAILCVFLFLTCARVFPQCAGTVTYTVSPAPGSGNTYAPGTVVTFCVTLNGYNQSAVNWFHGLGLNFGPGWDVSSLTVISEATSASTGTPAVWGYFSTPITGLATGNTYPPGFYFETGSGNSSGSYDGNPGDNFGDDCVSGNCVWTFCFTITVSSTAPTGTSLSLSVLPTGDGQSGSWTSGAGACNDPATTVSTSVVGGAGATAHNTTCFGLCDGSAKVSGASGVPPFTYSWSTVPPQTTDSISGLCIGTYTCTITDAQNNTVAASCTVGQPPAMIATVPDTAEISCVDTGYLPVYLSSGTAPYTYAWSNAETVNPDVSIPPGTYTVTVTDSNSCTATASGTLTVSIGPNTMVANAPVIINDSCPGLADGSIVANISGGSGTYTYAWSNGQTSDTAINLAAGSYTLTATDAGHCTASSTYQINEPAQLAINPVVQNVGCFDSLTGIITTNVSGGTAGYAYNWTNGQSGSADTALGIGNYTLLVYDTNGCSISQSFTITQPTQLTISQPVVQNIGCTGGNTGAITVQVNQGTPPYNFTWLGLPAGQFYYSQDISGLPYGNYYLTVTDANGCHDTASYVIDTVAILRYRDTVNPVSCYGGSDGWAEINVTSGTRPYVFTWDYGTSSTDSIIINLSAGPVEVKISDANNCQAQLFLTIAQPAPLTVQLVNEQNVLCFDSSDGRITVTGVGGTPGYAYTWDNSETGPSDTALVVGQYRVQVVDTNGCATSAIFNVTQPTPLSINTPDIQNIGCQGGNAGVINANVTNGTPNYTFNWLHEPGGQMYTGQTIRNLPPGGYLLTVIDANGCIDTALYTVTAVPLLTFNVSAINVSCFSGNNGSAKVSITSGSPPYQFSWNNGAYGTDSLLNTITAGYLQINVTDSDNCLTDTTIYISQPSELVITKLSQTNELCNGGSNGQLIVSVNGGTAGYTYKWNNQVSDTVNSNLTAGNYMLVVLDNNDCPDTALYTITQPTPVVANPIAKNALCFFGADGTIDANPSGGTPLYDFLWSTGATTQIATGLIRGSYDCTVTDGNHCSIIFTDTIGQPTPMVIQNSPGAVKCVGQKNGTDTVSVTGDTPPYYYNATNDNVDFIYTTNGIILGLDTGDYTIQVSDSNGCVGLSYINVPPATPDEFYPPVADSTLCYGPDYNDGSVLILDSTIQNGPYQYSIDGGALQDTGYFENLTAGAHTITAVSGKGCVENIPVFVPQPLPIEAIVTPDTVNLPLGGSQSVMVSTLNAWSQTYNWANTLGFSCTDCPNPVVSGYASGSYVVTVSMIKGNATCYGSTTLYVNVLGHTKAFIPNVFTPNGDGIDDYFQIYGEDIKTASLKVFNRWGELVYSTSSSLAGWDGNYKGMAQMPGVFTYEAIITYLDDSQESRHGTVTLLK